jgi:anthranilate synthase component 2/para-aminobenzoate synthetase component 2
LILLIDNYDSFTYNIYDYVLQCGATCALYRNDSISLEEIISMRPSGIIISPGPKRPEDHALIFPLLEYFHDKIPILGICLGHQAIGEFFGCGLIKAPEPSHGKTAEIVHYGHAMYDAIPSPHIVTRYHSLILNSMNSSPLVVTARTSKGLIMSLAHKTLPVWGVQYHPEAILTSHGLQLFKNWLRLAN